VIIRLCQLPPGGGILNLLGLLAGMLWTFVLRAVLRLPYEARMFKEARPE
jgi:hypothetical protein